MDRAGKDAEIQFLVDQIKECKIALCLDYRGLTVSQVGELRSELRGAGAVSRVVKNTLAKRSIDVAMKDADGSQEFSDLFVGPSFLIFGHDEIVSPAKVTDKFASQFEPLEIKGAWYEGGFLDKNGVAELAKMPSKDESLSKLRYLLEAPATQLVRLLNAPGQKLAQVIEAHRTSNIS